MDTVLGADVERPESAAVCVIAGTAGVGKTSLAVRWAYRNRHRFPDGQLYVNLRGYDPDEPVTAGQALERFLTELGVAVGAVPADLEARAALFRSLLADRRILVVLDNAATVGQVRPLLPGAGHCLVLVTSRSRLSGLITRDGAHRITVEVFDEPEAVELLRTTTAGYRVEDADADFTELARLCARLPLALRIAAERAAARPRTPLDDLIRDLRDESSLWDALSSEDDEEADAVRTVFTWSYRALPSETARMFRLLGLHPGPEFSAHAAAALADRSERQSRHLLDALVGAHLLEQSSADRFQFHDLLRAYALNQSNHIESIVERDAALQRLLAWYLHAANDAVLATHYSRKHYTPSDHQASGLSFPTHSTAVRWYESERTNLVAATRAASQHGFDHLTWQLPAVLSTIYHFRHPFDDWRTTSEMGLEAARRVENRAAEALLLFSLGKARTQSQHPIEGIEHCRAALEIQRTIGDRSGEAETLLGLGLASFRNHSPIESREAAEQSLAIARELRDTALEARALGALGFSLAELGMLDDADRALGRAIAIFQSNGFISDELDFSIDYIGVQRELGKIDKAFGVVEHTLELATELDDRIITAAGFFELGKLHQIRNDHAQALVAHQQAVGIWRSLGHRSREAQAIDAAGLALRDLGRLDEAISFHRHAASSHHELHDSWHEAIALDHLAKAIRQVDGTTERAAPAWRQALGLLDDFDDTAAHELRATIEATLADS